MVKLEKNLKTTGIIKKDYKKFLQVGFLILVIEWN